MVFCKVERCFITPTRSLTLLMVTSISEPTKPQT
ncbi:hypothetical protein BRC2024_QFGIOCBO_CDS_0230 [Acinetobacter phage vB_AbaM_PhT2-v2]